MAIQPIIHNTRNAPFIGKVIAAQSGEYVIPAFEEVRGFMEQLLVEQRITNQYLSILADEEIEVDDFEEDINNA